MNMKIFFLAFFQICLLAATAFAQTHPCENTTISCLSDETRLVDNGHNWFASHGSLNITSNNAPTNTTGGAIRMWSYLDMGNGAFTCYNFQQGVTYRVCFWVRNVSGWPGNPWGRLYVYAGNNLESNTTGYPVTPPGVSRQLIDQSYWGPANAFMNMNGTSDWAFISTTFTAGYDYNCLWFYPLNPEGPPPPGNPQWDLEYEVEIDDIRVTEEPSSPYSISVSALYDPINGCNDQASLTISGMPSGTVATWYPAPASSNADGSEVVVKPCSTTTYRIEIEDPTPSSSSHCPLCIRETLTHTVNVNQWSDPANIVSPTSVVPCTTPLDLDYNDPGTCTGVTYTWIDPQGNPYSGKTQSITAGAIHTGEWTLQVWMPGKSCAEELKFLVTVGSCCISNPNFTFTGCNPITFTNTGTGIINHVSTLWNFGDGTTSNLDNPIHSYNVTTTTPFTVCLTMLFEDEQGESCCDRICQIVEACPNPNACAVIADFTYTNLAGYGNTFDFADASSGNGTICNYEWEFENGIIVQTNVPTVRHTFSTSGPWWVCLTVTNCVYDENGNQISSCTDKKCMWVDLPPPMIGKPGTGTPIQQIRPQSATAQGVAPINTGDENNKILTVYPNPSSGSFSLNLENHVGPYRVIVRDAQGKELYNREHSFNNSPVKITLMDVSAGVYSVEVKNENEKFVQQISITK